MVSEYWFLLQPLLTTKFDSDPVFYLQQSHLPSHMRSLRLSRHTDQRAVRHAPSKLRQALVTVAVIIAFVLSLACFSLSLYYWRIKEDSTPSIRQDGHESTGIPSAQVSCLSLLISLTCSSAGISLFSIDYAMFFVQHSASTMTLFLIKNIIHNHLRRIFVCCASYICYL